MQAAASILMFFTATLLFHMSHLYKCLQIVSGAIISAIETDTHDLTDGRKALQKHIITDCRLLERLRGAVAGNSVGEAHGIKRRGYMGHVIRVSDALDIAENGGEWHSLNTIACSVNNNNTTTSTTDGATRETERDATYLHAVMKTDACFEWWSDFVDTTLEQATQLQNTPLGNFDVPTRDEETTDEDMMLTMDDSMSAMLDQLTHNNSSTAIEGTVGSDTHDTDDVDPTTVWGRAVGGFSSETVSSPQNSFMVNSSSGSSSGMHNTDIDHDVGTNDTISGSSSDNSGWANFADFGQQPFQTTQLQTTQLQTQTPVVEGFANFDVNFNAAFSDQSATTSAITAFANTTATPVASHQQQQQFVGSIDSGFEADFSQFMAPPSEHAPVIATAVHDSNSSTNSSSKSSTSDDEQSDVSSSSNDDTDDSIDDSNSAASTTSQQQQQQQYTEQINEDEQQPRSDEDHHDTGTATATSAVTTDDT
jgi:hypothetical protein